MKYGVIIATLFAGFLLVWAGIVIGIPTPTVEVKLTPAGLAGGAEASGLFDGDTETALAPVETFKVTVALAGPETISGLKVFGPASYRLTVHRPAGSGWVPVPSLSDLHLGVLSPSWNDLVPVEPFQADKLLLEFVLDLSAGNPVAGIRELEIRGIQPLSSVALAPRLEIPGTPGQLTLAGEDAEVIFNLDAIPAYIKRAFLEYDGFHLVRPVSVQRRINAQAWRGGFDLPVAPAEGSAWRAISEEINPQWLLAGENRIALRAAQEGAQVAGVKLLVETDNGWNYIAQASEPAILDSDNDTVIAAAEGSALSLAFERPVQPETLAIHLEAPAAVTARVEYRSGADWTEVQTGWTIDFAALQQGWNLVRLPAPVTTGVLRLAFAGTAEVRIGEIRVGASPVGSPSAEPRIVVSYPRDGEYFGRNAYIQGFVTPMQTDAGAARLSVEGRALPNDAADGSFSFALAKDATRFAAQVDDQPWEPVLTAFYRQDGEKIRGRQAKSPQASLSVPLYKNALPAEQEGASEETPEVTSAAASSAAASADINLGREKHSEKVLPGQAKKIQYRDVILDIPEGAVDVETEITIIPLAEKDLAQLDAGMVNVTYPAAGYRFLPKGMKFKKAVKLSFGYTRNFFFAGQADDAVQMYFYHDNARRWEGLKKVAVDQALSVVVSETDHFTDIINATLVVPEHPEALTYNPNTIKDIKAADPGAGINLIEPPQANNQGDARLSYPIELPPGRKGMQPQLAIAYNSGGGNGWLGLGWDLSTPAVTVDTRWGVPRYGAHLDDDDRDQGPLETETYLLDGEMLTPVAHRGAFVPRTAGDMIFHPRVEGQFRRIVRHGDAPNNFWWEVTDKGGTRFLYGGRLNNPGGAFDPDAVLADPETGNIFRWGLAEVRDVHGNTISYTYKRVDDTGLDKGKVVGRQLYLQTINYTGFQGEAGAFTVTLIRDRDLEPFQRREDVIIDCRPGFKTVTADLLKKIRVDYNNQTVRSYELFYRSGAFGKTLLDAVAQYGSDGHEFNRHTFGYFDHVRNPNSDDYDGFGTEQDWKPPYDTVMPPVPGGMPPGFPSAMPKELDATALSGSNGYNLGGHLFVGVGIYSKDKSFSIGGKAGYSQAQNEGVLALVDIDGDGLADKVFRSEKDKVSYRRGSLQSDGSLSFAETPQPIIGLTTISKDKSKTLTHGLEGFIYVVSFHDDISDSLSRGTAYFSDVNGDGLVDLVNRGNVLFNHLENGVPVFSDNVGETGVPIGTGILSSAGLLDDTEMTRREEEARKLFPLVDAVRIWSAPYDGSVQIGGTVALVSANAGEEPVDGVRVSVQRGQERLWSRELLPGSAAVVPENTSGGPLQVTVKRGQRLYFRVQSRDNGSFDRVAWAPQITYLGVDTARSDVNDLPVYAYDGERDFVLYGRRSDVLMPYKGQVRLTGAFHKRGITSDDVRLVVAKNGTPIITRLIPAADADVTIDLDESIEIGVAESLIPGQLGLPLTEEEKQKAADKLNVPLDQLDRLEFRLEVDSPIDLSRLSWTPQLHYTSVDTAVDTPVQVLDANGNYQLRLNPSVDADIYPDAAQVNDDPLVLPRLTALTAPQEAWVAPKNGDLLVVPRLAFNFPIYPPNPLVNSELVLTVKRQGNGGELLAKGVIPIRDGQLPPEVELALVAPGVKQGDRLFFDLSSRDPSMASYLNISTLDLGFFAPLPLSLPLAGTASAQPIFSAFNAVDGRVVVAAAVDGRMVARNAYQFVSGKLVDPPAALSFAVKAGSVVSFAQVVDSATLGTTQIALKVTPAESWTAPAGGSVAITPSVAGTAAANGTLRFEVRRGETVLASSSFAVSGGAAAPEAVQVTVTAGERLEFRFLSSDLALVKTLTALGATVVAAGQDDAAAAVGLDVAGVPIAGASISTTTAAVLHSARIPDLLPSPFRGWAYLAYNGNGEWGDAPIDEDVLHFDKDKYHAIAKRESGSEYRFSEERVWPLIGRTDFQHWGGLDEDFSLTAAGASSSRLGPNDITLPRSVQVAGTRGVERISEGTTDAVGAGVILNGSKSSGDHSGNLLDFFDLNGDRFPDIVSQSNTQYTHPTGALYDVEANGVMRSATNGAWNVGVSGNPVRGIPSPRALFNASKSGGNVGSAEPSISLSAGVGGGDSVVDCEYLDLNGDGLPDRVYRNGKVQWNLGYKYTDLGEELGEFYGHEAVDDSKTANASFGGGYNSGGIYMMGGGVNLGYSLTRNERILLDLNGDGLPDQLKPNGEALDVAFNSGSGFLPPVQWHGALEKQNALDGLGGSSSLTQSNSASLGGGVYMSYYLRYQVAYVQIVITINPGINGGLSTSRQELAIRDVNGDGYPDHVRSEHNANLDVALSNVGTTNLLKSVERPLGGRFELAYERSGNTQDQPQSKWVLSRVVVDDGVAGDGPAQKVAYRYADGKYSRMEREFYGYRTVLEERGEAGSAAYRETERIYATDSWYAKGLLRRETVRDEAGRIYTIAARDYALIDPANGRPGDDLSLVDRLFPRLGSEATGRYEGQLSSDNQQLRSTFSPAAGSADALLPAQVGKINWSSYTYDDYGNVATFTKSGEPGPADDVTAAIEYDYRPQPWLMSLPRLITVSGGDRNLYRHREGVFDSFGDLVEHRAQIRNGSLAQTDLAYDQYGNVMSVTGPENASSQRYTLGYTYDDAVHTYVAHITDSFGYFSTAQYDQRFGVPLETVDLNGNHVAYLYDAVGRGTQIRGPYDQGAAVATIAFEYHPEAHPAWARTFNKEDWEANDTLDTFLYIDGLKRVLQTKKEAEVLQGERKAYGLTISGKVEFDALGRSIELGQPLFEAGYHTAFTVQVQPKNATLFAYDLLDRTTSTTLSDSSLTTMAYGFEDGMFLATVTDAEQKVKKTLKDVRGNIVAVKEKLGTSWIITRYAYDPLAQIVRVSDDKNNLTSVNYDQLGRRTAIANSDAGLIEYLFDAAGNLTGKITPNLRQGGQQIDYRYDYTRLRQIDYPASGSVAYNYGPPGAEHNRAGRIVTVTTPDYRDERFYGKLGETVKTIKSIRSDVPSRAWPLYTSEYRFDSFGRMQRMTYPDGEVLSYGYDQGGLLESAAGVKGGKRYEYLLDLAYDEFGQRVQLQLGNKVLTRYSYDPLTRRLDHILTLGADGSVLQNQDYAFDRVGNVTTTDNRAFVTREDRSRNVTQSFGYDDLHRLVHADGTYAIDSAHLDRYDSAFVYDTIGNFVTKDQRHWYEDVATGIQADRPHSTFDYSYLFAGPQPHAVTNVGGDSYRYDANGNMIERIDDQTKQLRQLVWDEENRLSRSYDQGKETIYRYDDAGTRIVKRGKYGETTYVDPTFSIREAEVASKHVFAGNTRIATKMVMMENRTGTGKTTYVRPDGTHGHSGSMPEKSRGASDNKTLDLELQKENSGRSWVPRERRTDSGKGKGHDKIKPDNSNDGNNTNGLENALSHGNGNKYGIYRRLDRLGYEVTIDHRIVPQGSIEPSDPLNPIFTGPTVPEEHQIYYYHGDHLGSSTVISDRFGRNYEHLQYFPYGETWVEEARNQTNLPYKFTGKELDPETGLYYFGARYYDARVGVWESVDPILGQYLDGEPNGGVYSTLSLSLYCYAGNNPVVFVDPDGRFKLPIHERIVKEALSNTNHSFSNIARVDLIFGATSRADVFGAASDHHFDGRSNYNDVKERFALLNASLKERGGNIGSLNKRFGGRDVMMFGVDLHNIADFYSHSNYAELYIEYYKGKNNGKIPDKLPIFDDGINDKDFGSILKDRLKTGEFNLLDNEFFDFNPFSEHTGQNSHAKMNKDLASGLAGGLAEQAAIRHTEKIINELK